MNNIYYRALKRSGFTWSPTQLIRPNLFNINTQIIQVNPSIASPLSIHNPAQMASMTFTLNGDYTQPYAQSITSAWGSAGWDILDEAVFVAQLKAWANNNIAQTEPGYNLKTVFGPIVRDIEYSYFNSSLVDYTYDGLGEVAYQGSPDLSSVVPSHSFIDGNGKRFNVVSVDNSLKTVDIVDPDTLLPPESINTVVLEAASGSIVSFEEAALSFMSAFLYSGNQGTLI